MKDNVWVLCEAGVLLAVVVFGYVMLFRGAWDSLFG